MNQSDTNSDKPRIRRRWMVAVMALITLPFVTLLLGVGPVGNPDVTATFTGFTNSALGKAAMFELRNPSALGVRVESYVEPGAQHSRLREVPPGEGAMMLVELASFPTRGQDTAMEEGREMLDSVLRSVGVAVPGLNPDSEQNKFEIVAEFPADF